MKKVMVFGTFDILHPGHLDFFRQAKQDGDYLLAVVAHDRTVQQVKKHRPLNNQAVRVQKVAAQSLVDQVIAGQADSDRLAVVLKYNPAVIYLGYDQRHFVPELLRWIKENNLKIIVKRAKPYRPEQYKSSKLRSLGKTI